MTSINFTRRNTAVFDLERLKRIVTAELASENIHTGGRTVEIRIDKGLVWVEWYEQSQHHQQTPLLPDMEAP